MQQGAATVQLDFQRIGVKSNVCWAEIFHSHEVCILYLQPKASWIVKLIGGEDQTILPSFCPLLASETQSSESKNNNNNKLLLIDQPCLQLECHSVDQAKGVAAFCHDLSNMDLKELLQDENNVQALYTRYVDSIPEEYVTSTSLHEFQKVLQDTEKHNSVSSIKRLKLDDAILYCNAVFDPKVKHPLRSIKINLVDPLTKITKEIKIQTGIFIGRDGKPEACVKFKCVREHAGYIKPSSDGSKKKKNESQDMPVAMVSLLHASPDQYVVDYIKYNAEKAGFWLSVKGMKFLCQYKQDICDIAKLPMHSRGIEPDVEFIYNHIVHNPDIWIHNPFLKWRSQEIYRITGTPAGKTAQLTSGSADNQQSQAIESVLSCLVGGPDHNVLEYTKDGFRKIESKGKDRKSRKKEPTQRNRAKEQRRKSSSSNEEGNNKHSDEGEKDEVDPAEIKKEQEGEEEEKEERESKSTTDPQDVEPEQETETEDTKKIVTPVKKTNEDPESPPKRKPRRNGKHSKQESYQPIVFSDRPEQPAPVVVEPVKPKRGRKRKQPQADLPEPVVHIDNEDGKPFAPDSFLNAETLSEKPPPNPDEQESLRTDAKRGEAPRRKYTRRINNPKDSKHLSAVSAVLSAMQKNKEGDVLQYESVQLSAKIEKK